MHYEFKQYGCCKRYQTCFRVLRNYYELELVNKCFSIKKNHLFPCFVLFFFLRLLEQLALSISHNWLLAPTRTKNRGSIIGFLNHASSNYFWSDPAIPFPRALSFWSRQLKSTLLQRTAIFRVMDYVLAWLCIAVNDFLSSRSKRVACIFWSSVTHSSSCMKLSCPASRLHRAYPSVVLAFLSRI